jgi:hypothetical protein
VLWSAADVARFEARYPNAPPQCRMLLGGWNYRYANFEDTINRLVAKLAAGAPAPR